MIGTRATSRSAGTSASIGASQLERMRPGGRHLRRGRHAFTCEATSAGGTAAATVTVKRDATLRRSSCEAAPSFALGASGSVRANIRPGLGTRRGDPQRAGGHGHEQAPAASRSPVRTSPATPRPSPARSASRRPQPPAAAPLAVTITQIATLPSPRACVSRRRFPIRLRGVKANKIVRAQIKLNRKQVRNVVGKALGLPIDLRGLPKGEFVVEIVTTDATGKRLVGKRTYRACRPQEALTGLRPPRAAARAAPRSTPGTRGGRGRSSARAPSGVRRVAARAEARGAGTSPRKARTIGAPVSASEATRRAGRHRRPPRDQRGERADHDAATSRLIGRAAVVTRALVGGDRAT